MFQLHIPLTARDGQTLHVLIPTRISGKRQDEKSCDDQLAFLQKWLKPHWTGPVNFIVTKHQESGERLIREDLEEIERWVLTQTIDLVLMEDLGRYMRHMLAMHFCERCLDVSTRVIALGDNVDTAEDDWEDNATFATWHHRRSNKDTSRRIKRTFNNRFNDGGILNDIGVGYIKPPGCKSDRDVRKDPFWTAVYDEWFTMLENGGQFTEISDWLISKGVAPGGNSRKKEFTSELVAKRTYNPLIAGIRQRGKRESYKVHGTGKYETRNAAPENLKERSCPHLAHIDPERYFRVVAMLKLRNANKGRKKVNGVDPLLNRPRNSRGQEYLCSICGRPYHFGGHGIKDHMVCSGAIAYRCWNGMSIDANRAMKLIADTLHREICGIEGLDQTLMQDVVAEAEVQAKQRDSVLNHLQRRSEKLQVEKANLQAALREYGPTPEVTEATKKIREEEIELSLHRSQLEKKAQGHLKVPALNELTDLGLKALQQLSTGSREYHALVRKLIPSIKIVPVRLLDESAEEQTGRPRSAEALIGDSRSRTRLPQRG
jgi:hypothetical protein